MAGPHDTSNQREVRAGLPIDLNSDDPTMHRADLGKEYVDFVGRNRHGPNLAKQLVHNGVDAALLDNTEKVALHRLFDDEISALDTERVRRRQRAGPADRITGLQPEGILR
jgi:adenosine deaminase